MREGIESQRAFLIRVDSVRANLLFARALAADPKVVLMDEPFGAVDPIVRTRLQDELISLQARLQKTIVLVTHDMVGLFDRFVPTFVKQYTKVRPTIIDAIKAYAQEVRGSAFPTPGHSFGMSDEALAALTTDLKES